MLKVWNLQDLKLDDPCILRRTSSKTRFGGVWQAPVGDYMSDIPEPTVMIDDPELDLKYQLHAVRFDVESLELGYCNLPSIFPYFGVCVIPSAFGCEIEFPEYGHPMAHSLFEVPEDVYKLKMPDLRKDGLCPRVLDRIDYFQEKTKGTIPIRGATINDPLDVATQIWNINTFMMSTRTHRKEIHHLMSMVTDAIIEFTKIQAERITNRFRYDHLRIWHERGIHIIGDVSGMISAADYEELVRPYHTRLSEAFDGISLRNCGQCAQVLPYYTSVKGFQGFDVYLEENDPGKVVDAIAHKGVLLRPLANKDQISLLRGKAGLFLAVDENQGLTADRARGVLLA
jgi:hypothetical protein